MGHSVHNVDISQHDAIHVVCKFSKMLEVAYGREINIKFSGNSSSGHSCNQHANCTLPQHFRHLWYCVVWQKLHILELHLCNDHDVYSASWYATPVRWMDYLCEGEMLIFCDLLFQFMKHFTCWCYVRLSEEGAQRPATTQLPIEWKRYGIIGASKDDKDREFQKHCLLWGHTYLKSSGYKVLNKKKCVQWTAGSQVWLYVCDIGRD
jgi:hypothetical protein